MTDIHIRLATPEDTPAMVAVYRAAFPNLVINEAAMTHERARAEDLAEFVAERDGRVVGTASIAFDRWSSDGQSHLSLGVHPDERGHGVGSALLARADEHNRATGGRRIRCRAEEGPATDWAVKRGFVAGRTSRVSRCDLSALPPAPPVPADVRIVPVSSVDDLLSLYEADTLAAKDIPGRTGEDYSFEFWENTLLNDPRMDRSLSLIAYIGDEVAAMTYVHRTEERLNSAFTGTHPGHRGRGLATLLKALALHAAAEAGASVAFTNNDSENAPMLAVNTRLGYRPFLTSVGLHRP